MLRTASMLARGVELEDATLRLGRKHCVRFDARFVNLMVAMIVVQAGVWDLHLANTLGQ